MLTHHTVIFGGSFDPPHVGHQAIVMWLLQALDAKEVIICPTYAHCFGKKLVAFEERVKMCELAFATSKVTVSTVEKGLPEPNLTFNLLKWYKAATNDAPLAFVIGADNLVDVGKWDKWNECTDIAKVIAIGRPGFKLKEEYSFDHEVYPVGISTVSSSEVKDRITKGLSIDGFVPNSVKNYIQGTLQNRGKKLYDYHRFG